MGLLEVKNLSHSFGDKSLYKNADFELFKGEHMGLVGQNGTGKTTLLNTLIGEITSDTGEIKWQKGVRIGYLDQHAKIDNSVTIFNYLKTSFSNLYETEKKLDLIYQNMSGNCSQKELDKASDYQNYLLNQGFYEIESKILKVADGLGITSLGMESILSKLSGGQRAKVILAKLLLECPNIMLLDEPTNFLDKEHVQWLTDFLKSFEGAFIIISHNFDFLDKVTTCILDIEFCSIKKYVGNFSKFINLKGLKRESYIREFQAQQKQIKKYESYISKNKARASTAAIAKGRQKALDKIDRLDPPESLPKPNFKFKVSNEIQGKALRIDNLEIGYSKPILPKINLELKSGEKVVITGFNGIGKSTLLKTLVGLTEKISGNFKFHDKVQVGYLEQDFYWKNKEDTPLKILSDMFPRISEREIRSYLSRCAIKSKHVLRKIDTLSGGEQSKVKLCALTIKKSNFLILDEPTNHIDSNSKEVLKKELINWEGTLILVSHEHSFYKDWIDRIINLR